MTDESPVERLIPARHIEIRSALCREYWLQLVPLSDVPISEESRRRVYSRAR